MVVELAHLAVSLLWDSHTFSEGGHGELRLWILKIFTQTETHTMAMSNSKVFYTILTYVYIYRHIITYIYIYTYRCLIICVLYANLRIILGKSVNPVVFFRTIELQAPMTMLQPADEVPWHQLSRRPADAFEKFKGRRHSSWMIYIMEHMWMVVE